MGNEFNLMSVDDLQDVYFDLFGGFFGVDFGLDIESFRDNIIECIVTGVPQDLTNPKYLKGDLPPGCIA